MSGHGADTKIFLAFRFHTNFYHSYRGDTPDELGFGKDIRIIRKIIEVLDKFNAAGVPACGTWDIENYFSLEKIMPLHCLDIIESLKRRVDEGKDEVQVMSYNNGLISAHTAREFDDAIGRAITNAAGSGVRDIFGGFGPMVRPQEMMYTPMHLKLYRAHGVHSISLFYSAVPFNGFSNFIRPLPFEQRYNPLTLTFPGVEGTMVLVPAYNHGDIADNISLRGWLKRLRRKQLSLADPKDLLLLIDADADDEYWYGYNWPVVTRLLAATRGLRGLIESVRDLDYVTFTTPCKYVKTHPPVGTVTLGQDTADGSFDGFSSWAEKWSNHQLWTGIERARILELQTRRLMELLAPGWNREEMEKLLSESYEMRLKSLSTTHFGLASPIMNLTRLRAGTGMVHTSVEKASHAFDLVTQAVFPNTKDAEESAEFALLDYVRGVSTQAVTYGAHSSRTLIRIPLSLSITPTPNITLRASDGNPLPYAVRQMNTENSDADSELLFVESMNGGEQKDFRIDFSAGPASHPSIEKPASVGEDLLENDFVRLRFDKDMQPTSLTISGIEVADGPLLRSAIRYSDRTEEASRWTISESAAMGNGLIAFVTTESEITFQADGEKRAVLKREFMLVAGLPYLYVSTHVVYPQTHSTNYNRNRVRALGQEYDGNWREVMPCEIRPALFGKRERPLRVWKHNYLDHMSYYDLDYGKFSKNEEIDSFNNHITHAWVAVTDRAKGLLVAQTADVTASFAFCPMRTRATANGLRIFLNPFGSYYGRQLSYATAFSGVGKLIALKMAESLDPHAPSYNGRTENFSVLITAYSGDEPPEEMRRDAEAFAYPYTIASRSKIVKTPSHRHWAYPALE
jgi:hypothetical protein